MTMQELKDRECDFNYIDYVTLVCNFINLHTNIMKMTPTVRPNLPLLLPKTVYRIMGSTNTYNRLMQYNHIILKPVSEKWSKKQMKIFQQKQ